MYSNPPYQYYNAVQSPRSVNNTASRTFTPNKVSSPNYTANEVSRIINGPVREGETVKGQSRINYVPYEKKVVEYENRQRVERVPKTRKVIEYQERKVVEQIPREVTMTDYYAVENITQYYKEVIPEKKIEMVPVERKRKKIQYIPVEKQIVHYPEGHDQSKSRVILGNQGINVRNDAEFKQLDPRLLYEYSNQRGDQPVGYYEDGNHRYMSTAPSHQQSYLYSYAPQRTEYIPINPNIVQPPRQQTNYQYQPYNTQSHYRQTIQFNPAQQPPRNTYINSNNINYG